MKTKFYGFSIQKNCIYENYNFTAEAENGLDGLGVYVYVKVSSEEITIKQDAIGCYGLFLYSCDDYFALSNSFLMLVEHLKNKFKLTLDRDYANVLLAINLASIGTSQTPFQEIKLLDNHSVVKIDKLNRTLKVDTIDYQEGFYCLDSEDGVKQLDLWFKKWTTLFRRLQAHTNNISVALSGGMDSRISFLLMLKSGVDLNTIRIHSMDDKLHTHAEDYAIATKIARHFGFKLNNVSLKNQCVKYSINDIFNICFYNKIFAHKEMYYSFGRYEEKRFLVPGSGGEAVRDHWSFSATEFIKDIAKCAFRYHEPLRSEIKKSISRIINESYKDLEKIYTFSDANSPEYVEKLYRHGRIRSHFGKASLGDYFSNTYVLPPLLDPGILKISLTTKDCSDKNLLMAFIYVRFAPELIQFEFEGNRRISQATIDYANKLNSQFPYKDDAESNENVEFVFIKNDDYVTKAIGTNVDQSNIAMKPDQILKSAFDSLYLKKYFSMYFDSEFCVVAEKFYNDNKFHPLKYIYPIVALTKLLEYVNSSNQTADINLLGDFNRYLDNSTECIKIDNFQKPEKQKTSTEDKRIASLEESLKNTKESERRLKQQLTNIQNGFSFKIGRCLTWLPRKIIGKKY